MTFTKNIFYNTFAQYLGKGIGLLTTIVVTYILTHSLGVSNYGQYVYLYALVLLINSFADWGSTFVATREASREPEKQSVIYTTTLVVRLVISLTFQIGLVIAGLVVPSLRTQFYPLLAASFLLPILSIKTSLQVVFQSRFQLWRLSIIDTLGSLFFMILVLLFSGLPNFNQLIFVYLSVSAVLGTVVGLVVSIRTLAFSKQFDLKFAKHLLLQSLSMGALLTLFTLYNRIDVFILKAYQNDTAVGIYGFSYKVYENLILGAGFLANATFPLLSSRINDRLLFKQAFEKYFAALFLLSLFASISLYLLAPFIINTIAGPDFLPAILPLRILSLALIGAFLGHSTGYSLVALNRQVDGIKITILALLLNVSLNLIFIPRYSYTAAALITLVTEIIAFTLGLWFLRHDLKNLDLISGFKALSPRNLFSSLKV